MKAIIGCAVGLALGGCVGPLKRAEVPPWQRGDLARPEMALDGAPTLSAYRGHVYYSKEAASGGAGLAGGGCGCN